MLQLFDDPTNAPSWPRTPLPGRTGDDYRYIDSKFEQIENKNSPNALFDQNIRLRKIAVSSSVSSLQETSKANDPKQEWT